MSITSASGAVGARCSSRSRARGDRVGRRSPPRAGCGAARRAAARRPRRSAGSDSSARLSIAAPGRGTARAFRRQSGDRGTLAACSRSSPRSRALLAAVLSPAADPLELLDRLAAARGCELRQPSVRRPPRRLGGRARCRPRRARRRPGDIPDNQVFLVFANTGRRLLDQVPGGLDAAGLRRRRHASRTRTTSSTSSSRAGPAPTPASVAAQLTALKRRRRRSGSSATADDDASAAAPAVKVVYTTESAPNPVTGKRVTLVVDRYVAGAAAAGVAIVDLGTPEGVDNVDAYRLMIESFRWR